MTHTPHHSIRDKEGFKELVCRLNCRINWDTVESEFGFEQGFFCELSCKLDRLWEPEYDEEDYELLQNDEQELRRIRQLIMDTVGWRSSHEVLNEIVNNVYYLQHVYIIIGSTLNRVQENESPVQTVEHTEFII